MFFEIQHGDSIKLMSQMVSDGRTADLIVTDPPYKLESGGNNDVMGGCFSKESYNNNGSIVHCDIDWPDFMPLLYKVLAPRAHCYVMANNRHVQNMLNAAEAAGFKFHNLLVWDKITCTPNRWYAKNCEYIGFFYKGNAKMINDCGSKQLIKCPQVDESKHPTEKPVSLFEHYILNSSHKGDTVLDPFLGSGSCGCAAVKNGRNFIGMEFEKKWIDVAKQRIMTCDKQPDMFQTA